MATTEPLQRRRRTRHPKAFGYLLNPSAIYNQAVENGTAVVGQPFTTVMLYLYRIADHCGIKFGDIISVYPDNSGSAPVYCIVAASNLSTRSRVPRTDIIEKAKDFLGTEKEPKWYEVSYE